MNAESQTTRLQHTGVIMPDPAAVFIAPEVDPDRIESGVVLHPGCRLEGKDLSIGPGCQLGAEGPIRLKDCQLGSGVVLGGGSFERATLLDGARGSDQAHVRAGCLLEEQVAFGHCCGFKQTILMPFTMAGSLVHFCDALLAGGSGSRDFSEIGSSFVHFNFTPHGDKATASLFGDVPGGVLLRHPRIFLGGQGGAVGPLRVAYGTVLAAGQILRDDVETPGQLVVPPPMTPGMRPYEGSCRRPLRIARNHLLYMGNLLALDQWYRDARRRFMSRTPWGARAHAGALQRLDEAFRERLERMSEWIGIVGPETERACFPSTWAAARDRIQQAWAGRSAIRVPADVEPILSALDGSSWTDAVQRLDSPTANAVQAWLQSTVDRVAALAGGPVSE